MEPERRIKRHLATISILLKDRTNQAPLVNQILTDHGRLIVARLGVNVQRRCIEHCTAIVTIIIDGTAKEISALRKKLDESYGVVAKSNILTK
ncbi:CopG family transcriptional regulator [bacterium]|jgi:putative iron-only hydrogenase system regulator|nr:CopG family transcriptional regulator [bacterium]MBT4251458.1 CopG family transcriptional regulator [bacterium]MBT4597432.1 CopG family transcriptional regulator [bacterium]MBT6754271.1 CopG family transcriptional regulator [bacterium]MBT7037597.1 CopG family transcriptional regulator [bacterium]